MTNPVANWYPDPHDPNQLRYWDGQQWTEHRAPRQPPEQPRQSPAEPVAAPSAVPAASPATRTKVLLFGARNVARQQADELEQLRAEMQRLGVLDVAELQVEAERLRGDLEHLRTAYAEEKARLDAAIADLRTRVAVTQEEEILQEVGSIPTGTRSTTPSPIGNSSRRCRSRSRRWLEGTVARYRPPPVVRSTDPRRRAGKWSVTSPSSCCAPTTPRQTTCPGA